MATISSTSSAQSASQFGLQQLKLQQAQRNADQAELTAQSLRVQAQEAQRTADRAQENARQVGVQSDQAQDNADRAKQGIAAIKTANQMQSQLTQVVNQVAARQETAQPAAPTKPQASPVVNTQGQLTGTVINTTA